MVLKKQSNYTRDTILFQIKKNKTKPRFTQKKQYLIKTAIQMHVITETPANTITNDKVFDKPKSLISHEKDPLFPDLLYTLQNTLVLAHK